MHWSVILLLAIFATLGLGIGVLTYYLLRHRDDMD